jgi:myo-inositol-hexaphosphate 3-phosphohydrolase/sugar lactone lactonase YvrE
MITRRMRWKIAVSLLCGLIVGGPSEAAFAAVPAAIVGVPADGETVPVTSSGDSADDPAIWVNPADPSRSIVIGNDKGTALEVYDLSGNRIQLISGGHGNVDVRTGFPLGSGTVDIAAAASGGIRVYRINPTTRQLVNITDGGGRISNVSGEGFCLYHSAVSGLFYAFIITSGGLVQQVRLGDADGDNLVDGAIVRSFQVGSEAEGCVADDERGLFYVSQEDVALWRYGAEPSDPASGRVQVDTVGAAGHLVSDVEGLTIVNQPNGTGYLIASAQNVANPQNSYFVVYERQGANAYVKSFRITAGATADGCSRTDGITAVATNLGPNFPQGLFVCQDDQNTTPGRSGNQDFKFVRLEKILTLAGGGPVDTTPPDTTITSGPPSSTTSTSATFTFTATEAGSTFLCTLDGGAEAPCSSGVSYSGLTMAPHHFEVKAKDPAGNIDPSAATWDWTVTSSPPADTTPPDTTITSGPPSSTAATSATFTFTATEAGSTFLCRLDAAAFASCASGVSYSGLGAAAHHFEVKATDTAGNVDQSPATWDWTITPAPPATGIISTVAGVGGVSGFAGDGGPATSALLRAPRTMEADAQGNLFITDTENHRIRKVDSTGKITTIAGTGSAGYSGDNGPATAARLNNPHGIAVDRAGNVYVADSPNQRVRRISPTGIITTVAGTGSSGYNGDGIPATTAQLNYPKGVEVGPDGALYISDANNDRVRRVDLSTAIITTVAGSGVAGASGDGGPATAARLNTPRNVAFGPNGDMYIADDLNFKVRKVSAATGIITTVAGTGVAGYGGDGGPATAARMNEVRDVAVDGAGNVYIADEINHRIRRVDPAGVMSTFAGTGVAGFSGDGGAATAARIRGPRGVAVDPSGRVLIGDTANHAVRRVA